MGCTGSLNQQIRRGFFEFCATGSSLGGMKANAHIYSPRQINISPFKFLVEQLNLKIEKLAGHNTGKALFCRNHKGYYFRVCKNESISPPPGNPIL